MHVELRRSGGIAGLTLAASSDGTELPPDQREALSGLLALGPPLSARDEGGAPDGFSYELTIVDGDRRRTFTWEEANVPPSLEPLVTSLAAQARPSRNG